MTGSGGNKITLWDGAIDDAATKAYMTEIKKRLDQLGGHKETLLSLLRDARVADAKGGPFDPDPRPWPDRAWFAIEGIARLYHTREWAKREAMSNADRKTRLRKIAETLGRARATINDAINAPDLANDLIWGWWEGTTDYVEADGGFVDLLYIEREFEKVLGSLAALEAGAARAADGVHTGHGRPRGTSVLPPATIYALADVYRHSTGAKPGAGLGPFAEFLGEFLRAMGRSIISDATVIDAIKDLRTDCLRNPGGQGPSPFEDEP